MNKLVIIKADINGGDYVTSYGYISDEEIDQLKYILFVIEKSNNRWGTRELCETYNDPYKLYGEFLTNSEIEFLTELCPIGDPNYPGIQRIEEVLIVDFIEKLL